MKHFSTDHYFQIGSQHYQTGKPCQDYALSGGSGKTACAIVSDGCSTGRHTDVGSRIQALSLIRAMQVVPRQAEETLANTATLIAEEKKKHLIEAKDMLGLGRSDMLATSVYAYLSEKGGVIHVEGDGAVARLYVGGSALFSLYEWNNNMPFYPAYDEGDLGSFIKAHGNDLDAPCLTRTNIHISARGEKKEEVTEFSLRSGLQGILECITTEELDTLQCVAVFTDGVAQIEGMAWSDAIKEFTAFKNLEGEFAKRRMIRGLKNYEREGHKPIDDISIAVIRIEHIQEEVGNVDH